MPFSPITVNSKTFIQSGDGRYMNSTVTFGAPADYFLVKGASRTKDGYIVGAITRVIEKDVTVNGVTKRLSASEQRVFKVPETGFSSTELDTMDSEGSTFITAAILDRILTGES
jgi:hypothetical protein